MSIVEGKMPPSIRSTQPRSTQSGDLLQGTLDLLPFLAIAP